MIPVLRIAIPSLWIGLLGGLAFIETPLKFLAPGVTVPLALGIGRIVLMAAELAGVVLLVALTILSWIGPRRGRTVLVVLGGLWVLVIGQLVAIRPTLNARTDVVLSGGDPGPSPVHAIYVVVDLLLLALLVAYLVIEGRAQRIVHAG